MREFWHEQRKVWLLGEPAVGKLMVWTERSESAFVHLTYSQQLEYQTTNPKENLSNAYEGHFRYL